MWQAGDVTHNRQDPAQVVEELVTLSGLLLGVWRDMCFSPRFHTPAVRAQLRQIIQDEVMLADEHARAEFFMDTLNLAWHFEYWPRYNGERPMQLRDHEQFMAFFWHAWRSFGFLPMPYDEARVVYREVYQARRFTNAMMDLHAGFERQLEVGMDEVEVPLCGL